MGIFQHLRQSQIGKYAWLRSPGRACCVGSVALGGGWVWKWRSRVPNSRAKLGGGDGCVEHDYKDAADLAYHAVNAMCW